MKGTINRKLNDILTLTNDPNPEVIEALQSVDVSKLSTNTPVRSTLEESELSNLKDFIESLGILTQTIDNINVKIDLVDQSCEKMLEKLSIGQKGVDEVIDMTSALYTQQEKQRAQLSKIQSFIEEFYLIEEDFRVLESGDMTDKFFESFSRLEASIEKTSMAIRTNQSRCLLDASNSLNQTKERAYQRIYNWLHINSHLFDRQNPTLPAAFHRCLAIIKAKQFLYSFIREEISKVRGIVMGRLFMKILSTGDGDIQPLELISGSDPLQFTGDVFAWVHQSSATEAAFLANILKEQSNNSMIQKSLSIVFDSVCRPIETRIIQAIKGLVRPSDLYQIANICAFYYSTFGEICGVSSGIAKTLSFLKVQATEGFRNSINDSVEGIKSNGKPTQGVIVESIKTIKEITDLHRQSSLTSSFDVASLVEGYAVEIESVVRSSKDPITFQANTLFELLTICKDSRLNVASDISKVVEELTSQIVNLEVEEIFRRCRIIEFLMIINQKIDQPLSTVKGMEESSLRSAIKRFESSLVGSGPIVTPLCEMLSNMEFRISTKERVTLSLFKTYELLFNTVMDVKNGYSNPGSMFKHTPSLFKELLKV